MFSSRRSFVVLLLICLGLTVPAHAYVDLAPTLAKVIADSKTIAVVEVVEFNREKHVVVLKEIRLLKGESSAEPIQHDVTAAEGAAIPRQILQWAAPGARGVLFVSRNAALVCVGRGWYQVRTSGTGPWKLGKDRPDLPLAYYGPVSRLADSIALMIGGKDAVITVVAHGADNEGASFDLALNRSSLPGLVRVERIRANMRMPGMVMAASANPAYLIGDGPVDEGDLARAHRATPLSGRDGPCGSGGRSPLPGAQGGVGVGAFGGTARQPVAASPSVGRGRAAANQFQGRLAPSKCWRGAWRARDLAERRGAAEAIGLAGPAAAPLVDNWRRC